MSSYDQSIVQILANYKCMCPPESQPCPDEAAPAEEQRERGAWNLQVKFPNLSPGPSSSA